jgi:uncharacterized membrane protein
MKPSSLKVTTTVIIASLYSIITVSLGTFSYSWVQVRISEALTPLPFIMGFPSIMGLVLGVIIANFFSPIGLPDIIFGPLLTLFAAILSLKASFGKRILACSYPVIINSLGVNGYVYSFYGVPYIMSVATIAVGEFIAATLIGYPLLLMIERVTANSL